MRRRSVLPARLFFTAVHLWFALFASLSVACGIYLQEHTDVAVRVVEAGTLGIVVAVLVNLGLSSIWQKR